MMHLVTGEYPPARGGVADYTAEVAAGLAADGETPHVWCPGHVNEATRERGVVVHRALGRLTGADLRRSDALLDACPPPRRLLVQWVPHAFGRRSMNVAFCTWVRRRAAAGDRVEIMVHEPFLPFSIDPRQMLAALVHRGMTITLLRAADRVWVATPAWAAMWRPYALGRPVPIHWLPVPATITPHREAAVKTEELRRWLVPRGGRVIGAFSARSPFARSVLIGALPQVLTADPKTVLVLIGNGAEGVRDRIVDRAPGLGSRVHATGPLDAAGVSAHIAACDVAVQPYPDGICTRHSSAMTVLAHGVPMVSTTGRFTESVWRESGAVVLVAPGDTEALAAAIQRLVADTEAQQDLRKRSRALYDARFDRRHTVAALLAPGVEW